MSTNTLAHLLSSSRKGYCNSMHFGEALIASRCQNNSFGRLQAQDGSCTVNVKVLG